MQIVKSVKSEDTFELCFKMSTVYEFYEFYDFLENFWKTNKKLSQFFEVQQSALASSLFESSYHVAA